MKRVLLFLATNLAVMLVLSITAGVLGVNRYLTANGPIPGTLLALALLMGFGGAFISLLMSTTFAKWSNGAQVITHPSTSSELWASPTASHGWRRSRATRPSSRHCRAAIRALKAGARNAPAPRLSRAARARGRHR